MMSMILDLIHRFSVITFMSMVLFQKSGTPPSALHRCFLSSVTSSMTIASIAA